MKLLFLLVALACVTASAKTSVLNATIKPDRPSVVEVLCKNNVNTIAPSEVSRFVVTIDGIRTNVINISSSSADNKAFD